MFSRWLKLKDSNYLIIGPRRAGKTTLLRCNFPDFQYVTLDDFDYLEHAQSDPKGFIAGLLPEAIIDEVQRVPHVTVAVKQFIDNGELRVLLTGSSGIGLLDPSADSLAGRIEICHFPTACFGEADGEPIHNVFDDELSPTALNAARRKLNDSLMFGGFPEIVSAGTQEQKKSLLKMYRNTFFTRDLAQLSNIENIEGLLAILMHVVRSIGSHLEVSSFARESGLSYPTAKKYINVLTQSELAFKLYGYHYGPAKRYLKASKLYFADNGIIQALGVPPSPGQLLEQFVISELEKRRKLGFIQSDQFYYYKSVGGAEIDLIFEQNDEIFAVEVKATKNPSARDVRSLKDFSAQKQGKRVRPFLFCNATSYAELDGVKIVPVHALYRAY